MISIYNLFTLENKRLDGFDELFAGGGSFAVFKLAPIKANLYLLAYMEWT